MVQHYNLRRPQHNAFVFVHDAYGSYTSCKSECWKDRAAAVRTLAGTCVD
jgi:hypothetical protein